MLSFTCSACGQLVFFENSGCLRCGSPLGFLPERQALVPLERLSDEPGRFVARVDGSGGCSEQAYRRCANEARVGCNWMVAADDPQPLCECCRLTRRRPNDDDLEGASAQSAAEAAKRRLVFQLRELDLPIISRADDPEAGLAFDLLSSRYDKVLTGHDNGLITLDLSESDDAYREQLRQQLGEPYRTLLGHFRHEIGHYYWPMLVSDAGLSVLGDYRQLFDDERVDYGEALSRHYTDGPPVDWPDRYVSSYATMHPWEDWAETFAHYLHICDTVQTAAEYGLQLVAPSSRSTVAGGVAPEGPPPVEEATGPAGVVSPGGGVGADPAAGLGAGPAAGIDAPTLASAGGRAPWREAFDRVIDRWLPLSYALNAVNRSMGRDDLYPFVLAPTIIAKLSFVHERVQWAARWAPRRAGPREGGFRPLPHLDRPAGST
jgi:hypothetical protein